MNVPMDDVAIEQYANWLDNFEKTDPDSYKEFIAMIQSQLQTAELEQEAVSSVQDSDNNAELYDMLKSSASARGSSFKPRFPGDKVMGEDGLKATQEGMYIDVKPGFLMKTNDTKTKKKVFVNVVYANEIHVFSKTTKLNDEGNEQEGIQVPLSLSAPREVKDKMGASSLAFDVAVNTKVVENCHADKTGAFRNFVCELAIKHIDQKYKIKLNDRYKLPRLTYLGELPPPKHYIRKTQAPIIQEVTTEISAALKKTRASTSTAQKVPLTSSVPTTATAHFDILEERKGVRVVCQRCSSVMEGSTPLSPAILEKAGDRLIVCIKFENNVQTASDVELELQAERLTVKTATHNDLEIFLPYPVDVNSTRVCFDQVCNTMDVILTIDKFWDTLGPDCGSAPWLLARAKENDLQVSGLATTADSDREKPKTLVEMFQLANGQTARQWDPIIENEELPEDQFHRKDVMSMHILEQQRVEREQKTKQPVAKRIRRRAKIEATGHQMYQNEPEITHIDVDDIVQQEISRLDRHQQQQKEETDPDKDCMSMEDAKRMVAKRSENNKHGILNLQTALTFDLL
ncbi:unnamed protein product [Peronospora effusa]|uniref:PIH1 N-terminal domain-containing protein n=1 Tax=Peronospora effusa TaxID=542832 RepID=A0A3M6VQ74_9STRA|nr:hypothetical protein DD238_004290 [Peronospora effusa]CAI5703896.1 unnamed protein product [Peronospora effusa]